MQIAGRVAKKSTVKVAPSILSADLGRLAEEIRAAEKAGADIIHIDVMDGHFVPNITWGPLVVEAARRRHQTAARCPPHDRKARTLCRPDFAKAGADWISVHIEGLPAPEPQPPANPAGRGKTRPGNTRRGRHQPRHQPDHRRRNPARHGLPADHDREPRVRRPSLHPGNAGQDQDRQGGH